MTETALNERIAALQEIDASAVRQREKARYRLRRAIGIEKNDALLRIIISAGGCTTPTIISWRPKTVRRNGICGNRKPCMIISWKRTDWPESLSFSLREGQQYGIIHTRKATA